MSMTVRVRVNNIIYGKNTVERLVFLLVRGYIYV